jgi:DNA-binding LacI/PurR family transcriptional regulator
MRKPPTIHDVAGALGMHKSTVSLALSGKGNLSAATRARVLTVARELGYEPNPLAQRLANGRSSATVCIFSGVLDVGLATEKLLLIQKELTARSLEVPIYTCPEPTKDEGQSQATQIKQLCRQRPRAIICASQMVNPAVFRELEAYQREGGIVVSYDTIVPLECDRVIFDREDNACQAARHLLAHGHRRIGMGMSNTTEWFSGAPNVPQTFRLKGFRRALEEFGAPVRAEWLFANPTYEKGGAEMARRFLQLSERPTGLCIVNDYVALAFMVEVMRAGVRVPQDVSIVGHDDQPIASYCPVPLTSVSQPVEAIAQAVVDLLIERIEGSVAAPRTVTIKGELVQRESVAAPPTM